MNVDPSLGVRFVPTPDHGHKPADGVPEWVAGLPEPGTRRWWRVTYDDGATRRVAAHTEASARAFALRELEPTLGRAPLAVSVEDEGPVLP